MPTKKQRRRREKERRHEYEYVYVDEEGHEVEVEPEDAARPRKAGPARPVTRGGRRVDPPSWRRIGKRAMYFAPLMFLTVMLISRNLTLQQRIGQTILLLIVFLPFSYVTDSVIYRASVRRAEKERKGSS